MPGVKQIVGCVLVFAYVVEASTSPALSKLQRKQKLIQLFGNSVAMNLSSQVKTNGIENSIFINPWATTEIFFEVKKMRSPLAIFIDLMCYAALQWTVYLLDYSHVENTWKRVEIDLPRGQTGPRAFLHVKNFNSNNMAVPLAAYQSEESQLFEIQAAPAGFYKIKMRSIADFKQTVKVSVLVGGSMNLELPLLPPDDKVSWAYLKNGYLQLYWKPAELNEGAFNKNMVSNEIEYCLSVNVKKNLNHLCQVRDYLKKIPKEVVTFRCVRGVNRFSLKEPLSRNANHYVNVHAVDPRSNRSRSYVGLTLPNQRSLLISRLKQDSTLNLKIDAKVSYHVIRFDVLARATMRITYVACEGPITIVLARESTVLKKFEVKGIKTRIIKSAKVGTYFITLTNKFHKDLNVRIYLSSSKRWGPFPRLPRGIAVKEWPMLRTCNSITIAWIAGHGKQQFCLFIGRDNAKLYSLLQNVCFKPSKGAGIHRVECLQKRIRKSHKAIFSRTIKGLRPCVNYVFYIQVKRRKSTETLIYRPLRMKTRCNRCDLQA